jgi:hypothetical protein
MRNRKAILVAGLALALLDMVCDLDRTPDKTAPVVTTMPIPLANGANVRVWPTSPATDQLRRKTLTVVADAEHLLGPRAFTLDEDAPLAGAVDDDLTAPSDTNSPFAITSFHLEGGKNISKCCGFDFLHLLDCLIAASL